MSPDNFVPPPPYRPNQVIWLAIAAGIFVFVVIVFFLVWFGVRLILNSLQPAPTPAPLAPTAPVETPPPVTSPYATDSAVLRLKDKTNALKEKVSTTDFFEAKISLPSLDQSMNIKPQE